MTADETRELIFQDWRSRSTAQRTKLAAAFYAMTAEDKYPFECSGDHISLILGWLLEDMDWGSVKLESALPARRLAHGGCRPRNREANAAIQATLRQ